MPNAAFPGVAFFDRRKGRGEYTVDRRRTYVDIMEHVLGSEMLSGRPGQRSRFRRGLRVVGAAIGTAAAAVEVRMLDSIPDKA
jgi:hypothetical protein